METITADFIKNLISAEKSDELIAIYESILDELTTSDEKMVLGSVYNASVELDNLSEHTYVMALCMVELENGFDIRQINKVLFVLPNEGKYMPIEFHANNTSAYGFIDSGYYQAHDYDANFIADTVNAILEDMNMESPNSIYTTPDGQYFYMGYFND